MLLSRAGGGWPLLGILGPVSTALRRCHAPGGRNSTFLSDSGIAL